MKLFPNKVQNKPKVDAVWERVTRSSPCPICKKPDWCIVAYNVGKVCCMRAESQKKSRNGGWIHDIGSKVNYSTPPKEIIKESELDVEFHHRFLRSFHQCLANRGMIMASLCEDLGVAMESLQLLGCLCHPRTGVFVFPMRDGLNNVIGFRLRNMEGRKWAVKGSHQGLFIPQCPPTGIPIIVEGPTDCAAALSIGFYAIGRPSCSGGVYQLQQFIKNNRITKAAIMADLDDPGLKGAQSLAEQLPIKTAIMVVPAKDLRQAVRMGIDNNTISAMLGQLIWKNYGETKTNTNT